MTPLSDRYQIRSNRESGYERYDVLMIPRHSTDAGFIYATELHAHSVTSIWGIGVVVEGKTVWVKSMPLKEST